MVGYTSIRVRPTRDKVNAAESAYRAIKNGDTSIRIREGVAVKYSSAKNLNPFSSMRIATKIQAFVIVIAVLMLTCAALALSASAKENSGAITSLCLCTLLLTVIFGISLNRVIITSLQEMAKNIETMSSGDLSAEIVARGNNEITTVTQALRVLQTNIKLLIGQIKQTTGHLNNGASEIAEGNADLSSRTESQASSLEETASSMEELTSTVKQNADNSR